MASSDNERTSPVGLFNTARSYWRSAEYLSAARLEITHPQAPITFLFCHAIELYLKAYLRSAGHDLSQLKQLGHRVASLAQSTIKSGLVIAPEHSEILNHIDDTDVAIEARYIVTGFKNQPTNAALSNVTAMLDQAVCSALAKRSFPVRAEAFTPPKAQRQDDFSTALQHRSRPQEAAPQAANFEPNIDARVAFYDILQSSEWSQRQQRQPNSASDWLERRLDRQIHDQLRQGNLTAWGSRCLTTTIEAPEAVIPATEWDDIEIDFAPLNPNSPRTSAMRRVRNSGFNTVYAGVRFSREQIYQRFPFIPVNKTPTPAGTKPDWPIRELFFHIQPDLLDRPDEAAWERIGNDLRDAFALNLIRVWGRPITSGIGKLLGERQALRLIDSGYWHSAYFTYSFFDETSGDAAHTYLERNSSLPEYTDLQINRAEALATWPR
jgi:hypothetical protein